MVEKLSAQSSRLYYEQRHGKFPVHQQVVNRVINTPRPVLESEVKDAIKASLDGLMAKANNPA